MKQLLIALLLLMTSHSLKAGDTALERAYEKVVVYYFLLEDCVISQAYTPQFREYYEEYNGDQFRFEGRFPNTMSSDSLIDWFRDKYDIPFPLKYTPDKSLALTYNVKITPEVVIVSEVSGEVLYQGRVDDLYFRVGKRKLKASTSELRDALMAIAAGKEIAQKRTEAIGCIINYYK